MRISCRKYSQVNKEVWPVSARFHSWLKSSLILTCCNWCCAVYSLKHCSICYSKRWTLWFCNLQGLPRAKMKPCLRFCSPASSLANSLTICRTLYLCHSFIFFSEVSSKEKVERLFQPCCIMSSHLLFKQGRPNLESWIKSYLRLID